MRAAAVPDHRNQVPMNIDSNINFDPRTGEPLFTSGSVATEPLHSGREPRKRSKQGATAHPNKAIDKSYEQWNRFENFLQFA